MGAPPGPRFDFAKALAMYVGGASPQQVAEAFGITSDTFYRHLNRKAPESRRRVVRAKDLKKDRAAAIARYAEGVLSYPEVAAEFKLSPHQVRHAVKQVAPSLLRGKGGRPRAFDHTEAARLYGEDLLSYKDIAKKFNVSRNAVYMAVKDQLEIKGVEACRDTNELRVRRTRMPAHLFAHALIELGYKVEAPAFAKVDNAADKNPTDSGLALATS